ncbi:alpha/beta fold hydrolase [Mycetocola spongiae]|uniref:alpha/beta fold hydrolase n=1 Tax=Mycetocola spongiae TaxID=2859226 RepID=UPI001CF30C74|nr:alpha/beta hydrolase [Mycetocola spongiae]UCR90096.1 alpha/beta hydrolase [Mycetocola spongiae]
MNTYDLAPARVDSVTLTNGRALGYAEFGSPEGTPVLFIAGAATGRLMHFGGELLRDRDIRLITFDRPGLGSSAPVAEKTLRGVAEDVRELLAALGLGTVAAVANSQGAPFGLALAAAGVVSSLTLVSPADELAHPALAPLLPAPLADLVADVAEDPAGSLARFSSFTGEDIWALTLGSVDPSDEEVYADPAFRALYRRALDEALSPGSAGYASDTLLAFSRWNLPLESITVPVSIWFGDRDTVHSPDLGLSLAGRIPTATRHIVDGVGGSLLWAEPGLFLGFLD